MLTICQNVARSIKIEIPSQIINNQGEEAQMLLVFAQKTGEALARNPSGGWIAMIREFDFQTVSFGPLSGTIANTGAGGVAQITGLSSTTGILANNFYAMGTGIPYNTTVASVDSGTQLTLSAAATATGPNIDYVFGRAAYALPSDFKRPIDNTMWDRGRYWQMRGPLSPQQWQFYKSSIYSRATVQRRFRFRKIGTAITFSIDPVPTDNGTPLVFEYISNAWCQSAAGVPQTSWLADSDIGILDEYLIQLGTEYRALNRLGLAFAEELNEYEREVAKAISADGGAATLDIAPVAWPFLVSPWGIQDGDFPAN